MTGMSDEDRAIHVLWEKHCAGQRGRRPWPPSQREIREEIERIEDGREWDDRAPGS
jgi:hypothetical protein